MLQKISLSLLATSIALLAPTTQAGDLTDSEREAINKRLQKIINKSEKTLAGRQAAAYRAYKSGLSSSSAAFELYLKCIEKVNFTDAGKKNSEFRDWKRQHKDKHSEPGFRLALRHQLNWLVLTIDATRQNGEDYSGLSSRAQSAIVSIFDNGKALKNHHRMLHQGALRSIFARAYGFGNLKVKGWPKQPLNTADIYEKLVFPKLREEKKSSALKSAWLKLISYEEKKIQLWSAKPKSKSIGIKKALGSPAEEAFAKIKRPILLWTMERDVFKSGDEAGAATRMLSHINKYNAHNDATKWANELSNLIAPKKKKNDETDDENVLTDDEIKNFNQTEDDE